MKKLENHIAVREIFSPEIGKIFKKMNRDNDIFIQDFDGYISGLTFHTILYGENYDIQSFETAENGPYYDHIWTKSENILFFGCYQTDGYGMFHVFTEKSLINIKLCEELVQHLYFQAEKRFLDSKYLRFFKNDIN